MESSISAILQVPNKERPLLMPTNWENETQVVIEWKTKHNTWQTLGTFLKQENP